MGDTTDASFSACRALVVGMAELHVLSKQREHRQQTSSTCHLLFLPWCKLITLLKVKERIWALTKRSHTQHFTYYTAPLRSISHLLMQSVSLSVYLSIYLSIYLSNYIYLSIKFSVSLSDPSQRRHFRSWIVSRVKTMKTVAAKVDMTFLRNVMWLGLLLLSGHQVSVHTWLWVYSTCCIMRRQSYLWHAQPQCYPDTFFTKALPHALVPLQQEVQTVVVMTEGDRSINTLMCWTSARETQSYILLYYKTYRKC